MAKKPRKRWRMPRPRDFIPEEEQAVKCEDVVIELYHVRGNVRRLREQAREKNPVAYKKFDDAFKDLALIAGYSVMKRRGGRDEEERKPGELDVLCPLFRRKVKK